MTRLADAKAAHRAARFAAAEDRRNRTAWWPRLSAWLFGTEAEANARRTAEAIATLTNQAQQAAGLWVHRTAAELLTQSPAAHALHAEQLRRLAVVSARHDQAWRWHALAQRAEDALTAAASACDSASETELFDAISKSKAIAFWSSLDTSAARDAVQIARDAIQALTQALPKRGTPVQLDLPDDTLDLVIDALIAPAIDILSWLNMDALDKAARRCRDAKNSLSPLAAQLWQHASDTQRAVQRETATLEEMEAPFLRQAADQVPAEIRLPPPKRIDLTATPTP